MGLPHILSGVRSLLLADVPFKTACHNTCTVKKAPPDVTKPFAVVQMPGSVPIDDRGWALRPLIQVNGWCPDDWAAADPDLVTWDMVIAAKKVFAAADYVTYEDGRGKVTYTTRFTDGPLPTEDRSRGDASPLQGYLIRVELTLQHI